MPLSVPATRMDASACASALFGLVLPLVCVLLAYNIKKENNL